MAKRTTRRLSFLLAAAALLSATSQAQFTIDNSRLPTGAGVNNSSTENVDFGDVDLDGDWDVVMADGGDDGDDQNRIWINLGGVQLGAIGYFADETSTRFPAVLDDSRDIEFVDFDNDEDLDIYVSNTSQLSNQGNRWWTNQGGIQAMDIGCYVDETATRWVGLGDTGSSIAPSQLIGGSFIDWSCDCDFGDLDNDGDLDLVHSSYGVSFGGLTPTRIFLNDGDGNFTEHNPQGTVLTGPTMAAGSTAIWCEGIQTPNTLVADGTECDVTASPLDIDVGDLDGDFDLDILHGARNEPPRMFLNRLDGSPLAPGGTFIFRDVTGAVFMPAYQAGTGHYEQELGDLDGDGDLDIYGLNWRVTGFAFDDVTMANDGTGVMTGLTVLPGSGSDDNEGDFLDYDNDGDIDLWIANFSGSDRLYRNDGGPGFGLTQINTIPNVSAVSLDADACDVDNDGDYDVLVAIDNFSANQFLDNTTDVPDTTPPYLPNVESVGDQTASATPVPARVHVYDNAPYYITWYNDTTLNVSVNGCALPPIDARSSAGQVFRGELPGNLVGSVDYSFTSSDEYGNTGSSAVESYTATYGPTFAVEFGTGTLGSLGEPEIEALSVPFANTNFYLAGKNAPPSTPAVFAIAVGPLASPFQLGNIALLNVIPQFYVLSFTTTDATGSAVYTAPLGPQVIPGGMVWAQFFVLDGVSDLYASSKGLELTFQ